MNKLIFVLLSLFTTTCYSAGGHQGSVITVEKRVQKTYWEIGAKSKFHFYITQVMEVHRDKYYNVEAVMTYRRPMTKWVKFSSAWGEDYRDELYADYVKKYDTQKAVVLKDSPVDMRMIFRDFVPDHSLIEGDDEAGIFERDILYQKDRNFWTWEDFEYWGRP